MVNRKYNLKEITLDAAFILFLLVIVTLYILYQAEAIQLGYRIAGLEDRVTRMKEEIKKLETKKAGLLSLRRVEGIARDDLGLTDPKPGQVIYEGITIPREKKEQ
jgi:cell division protein FtsB